MRQLIQQKRRPVSLLYLHELSRRQIHQPELILLIVKINAFAIANTRKVVT
jgi:hypothetical protein